MTKPVFKRATRQEIKVRLALCGATGSGKTYSALSIAEALAEGAGIAVVDTERSSTDRYADIFSFDVCQLETYSPETYMASIEAAAEAGYRVLVIDSLSHAWDGADGLLERVDAIAKRSPSKNSFNAWGDATPLQRRLVDTILSYPGHVLVTMRSKMEYIQETNDRGKVTIRKIGLAPVQRQGLEYEFDLVGDMSQEHELVFTKSRATQFSDKVIQRPGKKLRQEILAWAKGPAAGAPRPEAPAPAMVSDQEPKWQTALTAAPSRAALDAVMIEIRQHASEEVRKRLRPVAERRVRELNVQQPAEVVQ